MAAPGWRQRGRLRPVDDTASKPRNPGWILRADGTMAPADEEVEFSQPTLVMDLVDVATFLKHSTAPRKAPEGVGIDILTYGNRDDLSHINLQDSRTWHS